jgi:hypothetical protein
LPGTDFLPAADLLKPSVDIGQDFSGGEFCGGRFQF